MRDAFEMARLTAATCAAQPEQVLVLSTGIIGEPLPMQTIASGIARAAERLGRDEDSLIAAARGLMTTDTTHKIATREIEISGNTIRIIGMAKGAAMIGPNMATMLGIILSDARLDASAAQQILRDSVEESFNCISVEGHMSTNDTVLLLSSNQVGEVNLNGDELQQFGDAVKATCIELAKTIPNDGEGATHLIEVEVTGCRSRDDARDLARTIADSPLVKTAVAGADPNWGRIVSAAGYAGVSFDPAEVDLTLNGVPLYQAGNPLPFDAEQVSASIRHNRDTHIGFRLQQGTASIRFWTCDLTAEYVHLNADYHT
jgi:glutamate N-acetyltransferase/amino-acid N-acetyltransferase